MDLQVDFLDSTSGRMPVGQAGASDVLAAARAVLSGEAWSGATRVAVVNAFRPSQVIGNFFRKNAALAGASGAALDPRVPISKGIPLFAKSAPSAFSNPDLHAFLQSKGITRIVVIGVFAEGCVRATALAARALGYTVVAPLDAIATNSRWKLKFALSSMRKHGVLLPSSLAQSQSAT